MTDTMNPPQGDTEHSPRGYSPSEVSDLLADATLVRYSEGTGEHEGNTMAVFDISDGREIGVTMDESSVTPEELIGQSTRSANPYTEVSGNHDVVAIIYFEDPQYPNIQIRNTQALGLYEIDDA